MAWFYSDQWFLSSPAEKFLESIERNENYSLLLLNLLDNNSVELPYRISAAITFKNFVKRNWKPVSMVECERIAKPQRI